MREHKIGLKRAALATAIHTGVVYGAPLLGLKQVDIASVLGDGLLGQKPKTERLFCGMAIHALLGSVLFPSTYNLISRRVLPRREPQGSLCWAMILWLTGEKIVVPLLGGGDLFKRHPSARLTYFVAHVAYGLVCGWQRDKTK